MKLIALISIGFFLNQTAFSKELNQVQKNDFEVQFEEILNCNTKVYIEDKKISSTYLRNKKYKFLDSGEGYASLKVQEHLFGLEVVELIIPTTWATTGVKLNATVSRLKKQLAKLKKINFDADNFYSHAGMTVGYKLIISADKDNGNQSWLTCDNSNSQ